MFRISGRVLAGVGILVFAGSDLCAQIAVPLHASLKPIEQRTAQSQATALPPSALEGGGAAYRIGNGDVLQISVWGEAELNKTVTVRPDGKISLPLVDEVQISGLTPSAAQGMLDQRFARYIRNPQTTVIVSEVRSNMVYLTGKVWHPGAYPLAGSLNVVQLIARAGGLANHAKPKHIYVLRESTQRRMEVNYKALIEGRRGSQDVQLLPGDTVVVP
jgi:polysaccharide export outer membrane protein